MPRRGKNHNTNNSNPTPIFDFCDKSLVKYVKKLCAGEFKGVEDCHKQWRKHVIECMGTHPTAFHRKGVLMVRYRCVYMYICTFVCKFAICTHGPPTHTRAYMCVFFEETYF